MNVPELSLVVLVGVTGSGKSTFARAHFKPTEVISSDFCRGMVADDENDQSATPAAFELLHYIAGQRLAGGRLTVIDATNVQPEARRELVLLAREHDVLPVAIVLDLPEKLCAERNASRPDRDFGAHVLRRQRGQLRRSLAGLKREGFRMVHVLRTPEEVAAATITRTPLFNDLKHEAGPFDVIGDVHGCRAELEQLLTELGYSLEHDAAGRPVGARHPDGRRAIFVGDLVDRGPDTPGVLRLVMGMVTAGTAFCVAGNHEVKLLKALRGKNVRRSHGLDASMEQLEGESEEFRAEAARFIDGLIGHYVLDGGRLVVAHAGLIERYHGRASGRVREFCLYGQTTGETDEYGLPVRYPWAQEYRGQAVVLYGHTPVPAAEWLNNTLCLDTGCVFGGRLTALNYPERTTVSVPAARVYHSPARPFPAVSPSGAGSAADWSAAGRREPDVLDIGDVSGSRVIETAYLPRVGVRDAHAAAALEVMSRFAIDPRWLLYLPPTMSPVATAARGDLLEHPDQAFDAYRADGVESVLCEEKHMGSRAVLLVCRSPGAAPAVPRLLPPLCQRPRLAAPGSAWPGPGAIWTRTGRPFFARELASSLTGQVGAAAEKAGLFDELGTSWLLLDAEVLPWNAKAGSLLRDQYAAVGAAALASLPAAISVLEQAERPRAARRGRPAGADPVPAGQRGGVYRRLPALLLGHRRAGRSARRPVPAARLRRRRLPRAAAPVAPRPGRPARRRRSGPDQHHPPRRGGHRRSRLGRRRDPVVGGPDRRRGRGHGGQARRQPDPNLEQAGPARPEGARPGVPAHHLRPRLHRAGQPGPAAAARAQPQALAGAARICPGPGGTGPGCPRRAPLARTRMRLRRPGPRVRTRRPPPVTGPYHNSVSYAATDSKTVDVHDREDFLVPAD